MLTEGQTTFWQIFLYATGNGPAPMSKPGALSIITDARGKPFCIIETISAAIKPVETVTPHFAWAEGEATGWFLAGSGLYRHFFRQDFARRLCLS